MTHPAYDLRMMFWRAIPVMALVAVLTCAPLAHGQRGAGGRASAGARGGSLGVRAAPAFRGYPAPAVRGYTARPVYITRAAYSGRSGSRVVGRRPYGTVYGYGLGYPYGLGFYDSGIGFSYPGDYNPNDELSAPGPYPDANAAAYAETEPGPYAPQPGGYLPQPQPGGYQPQQQPAYRPAQPAPAPEDAVTLIFKDGRPPLQIHNYALTRTTLYVTDAKHRDIPVADLDLPATEKANADAGVPFHLPTP